METLIAHLFLARDIAHREHLRTFWYPTHIALGEFYDGIVDLADGLAEAYQGKYGMLKDFPIEASPMSQDIVVFLTAQLDEISRLRLSIVPTDTAIQNLIDGVIEQYYSTLYKLTRFKMQR